MSHGDAWRQESEWRPKAPPQTWRRPRQISKKRCWNFKAEQLAIWRFPKLWEYPVSTPFLYVFIIQILPFVRDFPIIQLLGYSPLMETPIWTKIAVCANSIHIHAWQKLPAGPETVGGVIWIFNLSSFVHVIKILCFHNVQKSDFLSCAANYSAFYEKVANTMQNDRLQFQTVANTRQMASGKKSEKKSKPDQEKIVKLFFTPLVVSE